MKQHELEYMILLNHTLLQTIISLLVKEGNKFEEIIEESKKIAEDALKDFYKKEEK